MFSGGVSFWVGPSIAPQKYDKPMKPITSMQAEERKGGAWDYYCSSRHSIARATLEGDHCIAPQLNGAEIREQNVLRLPLEGSYDRNDPNGAVESTQRLRDIKREHDREGKPNSAEDGGDYSKQDKGSDGMSDDCLGVVAEVFADELDQLRKDEYFKGTARDVAIVADMMR